jgi:two-component system phosphate regulon response regulator OmpR
MTKANSSPEPMAEVFDQAYAPGAPPHILIVDDDTRLRQLLKKYLSDNGFRVTTAEDAAAARDRLGSLAFDLIILDVMMPGESGIELTASLRSHNQVPILLLTARAETGDRIAGMECGADDYLTKPFEPHELVLRVHAILRRVPKEKEASEEVQFGAFRFYMTRDELYKGTARIRLTGTEAGLLKALALNAGAPLSREELRRRSRIRGNTRTVDVQVARLRRKIETEPKEPEYLQTARGRGYLLRID